MIDRETAALDRSEADGLSPIEEANYWRMRCPVIWLIAGELIFLPEVGNRLPFQRTRRLENGQRVL